jgi:broad specificity phosphatase PhoE
VRRVRLILVRHGQSEWNALGRLQGVSDPPLSAAGRAEAEALGAFVAALGPERVVSSDLRRARLTRELLGLPGDVVVGDPDPRWRESDLGDWTGRLPGELSPDEHAAFLLWRVGRHTPPGGESWAATRARVAGAARDLEATGARCAVVVTHGGPVRALCHELTGLDPEAMVPVANATVTIIETHPVPHLVAFGMSPDGRSPDRHQG